MKRLSEKAVFFLVRAVRSVLAVPTVRGVRTVRGMFHDVESEICLSYVSACYAMTYVNIGEIGVPEIPTAFQAVLERATDCIHCTYADNCSEFHCF